MPVLVYAQGKNGSDWRVTGRISVMLNHLDPMVICDSEATRVLARGTYLD